MSRERSNVCIYDNKLNAFVDAELYDEIHDSNIQDWQIHWVSHSQALLTQLFDAGVPRHQWPQSHHWSWSGKIAKCQNDAGVRTFSLECAGMTQGLMIVDLATKRCRLPSQHGQFLTYIDYIETAPWNQANLLSNEIAYSGVGTVLFAAAIELSIEEEFKGRIGLHSLPQAKSFYEKKCGMTDLGPDPQYQNLHYFEMTPDVARLFLDNGGAK